ncbi:MAG: ATP-binding protein, partial [Myxococcota bacterium]
GAALCTQPRTVESLYLDDGLHTQMVQVLDKPQPRVVLTGPDHSGRRTVSEALVWAVRGQHLLQVPLMEIIRQHGVGESQSILVNLIREAMLVDAALFLRVDEPMDAAALSQLQRVMRRLSEALHQTASAVLLALPETYQGRDRLLANADEVTFAPLEPSRQQDAWRDALEGRVEEHERSITARNFAATYSTPTGTIFRVVERALERQALHAGAQQPLDRALLIQEIHRQFDHNLGQLADVITTHVKLRDVVLSDHQRRQLTEVLSYARHTHLIFSEWGFSERSPYGNGLSVLFSGPPGTGKTLVAGALAHQLGRVLYRVDLSRVVDKYIGETEKNLRRIFDEAERAQAVLLFDEADSLFSKRTEVKSSNDRYANLEVNYLLQRMEQFKGVSILTTNFESGLDEAFMRRIRFKIEFPMPDIEERARLWRHLLPPAAPLEEAEEIEWELLGESFEMSGGHIRNALLRAAVRAAASNRPISQDTLMLAGMDEARELGILVNVRYDFAGYDETFDLEYDREVFGGQANEPRRLWPDIRWLWVRVGR